MKIRAHSMTEAGREAARATREGEIANDQPIAAAGTLTGMAVITKVVAVFSPAGEDRGFRYVAALPNMAGNCFGKACASFDAPWRVYEGLVVDNPANPDEFANDVRRHRAALLDQGFTL